MVIRLESLLNDEFANKKDKKDKKDKKSANGICENSFQLSNASRLSDVTKSPSPDNRHRRRFRMHPVALWDLGDPRTFRPLPRSGDASPTQCSDLGPSAI